MSGLILVQNCLTIDGIPERRFENTIILKTILSEYLHRSFWS